MRYLKGNGLMLLVALATACNKNSDSTDKVGNWVKRSEFNDVARSNAASFVLNDKAYVGTGYDGEKRRQDFWVYNPETNQWTQVASFPGVGRNSAVGMTIKGKGYVGTGYDGVNKLNDFYAYDPNANSWEKKQNFSGTARYGAVAFSLKNKGYISTGYDGNWLKDNWQYDPDTDKWTQARAFNGSKRTDASVFVIGNKAYVCMGTSNSALISDFYAFDGDKEDWQQLRDIDNLSDDSYDNNYNFKGSGAAAFTINGKGYITTGEKGSLSVATWEYDPMTDLWVQRTDFEGAARTGATGFTAKGRGYVVLGRSGSTQFDNMYEFFPTQAYNKND